MGAYLSQFSLFYQMNKKSSSVKSVFFISFFILLVNIANAQITSAATGAWATGATWVGGVAPTATDLVVIAAGHTITTAGNRTCAGITITGTLSMANGNILTVNGDVSGDGTWTAASSTRNISLTGNWSFNAAATSSGTATFTGANTQTLTGRLSSVNNTATLVINKTGGSVILGNTLNVTRITNTAGIFDPSTFLLTATTRTFTAGTLRVGAATWADNYSGAITQPAAGIIEYYAAGVQTINDVAYPGHLTISGSGTKTWTEGAGRIITGNLTINDGTTLSIAGGFAFTVTGTTSIGNGTSGTLSLTNATGTKTFTGAVTINTGGSLIETVAATLSFGNDVIISGTLTEFGAAVVGIAGSLTNNGTYTASTGVHTFSGATKTLSGSTTTTIASITVSGTYTNSGILIIETALAGGGTLTNTGTLNIGGTSAITALTVSAVGNTVNYTGVGAQTVKAVSYENLILSGSGAKSMLAGTAVLGEMSIAPTGSATASVGAGLNLIVNSLLLAGANQVSGTYGSTSSAATFQNNTFFAATTGILSVNMPVISTAAGGDWATTTTWVGNIVPVANQQVVIATTGAGAVTTGATYTCAGLTINSGAILTLKRNFTVNGTTSIFGTINFGSTNTTVRVMTFNDSVTINSGAVWDETNGGANTVLNTYFFSNSLINDATTFTSLTGLHTFSGTGMMLSGGTTTSIANVAVTGTYTNSGTLTVGTALTGAGTLINGNGALGTLNLGGTATITALTASAANNTVDYTGVAQTVYVPTSGIYHHLIFSGSAAKTLNVGITTINGNFTMAGTATTTGLVGLTIGGIVTLGAGTTFTAGAFSHNVAGNWINNGGTFTNTGSTINLNGTGAQSIISGGSSFNNFTITNTGGTCTASTSDITVAGTFTTDASTTLDMGTNALIVNTVAHSGTIKTQNTGATPITITKTWGGIVQYNSAAAQTIVDGNYNNLDGTGGDRTLSSTGTIFIAGTFTIGAGTYTVTSSTVDFNGTAAQNIPAFNFNNLTISGNKGGGAITLVNGGTIGVAAIFLVTATNTSYVVTGNTFDYNGSGAQTIIAPFDYNNLVISNAGVKTILTATTVNCQTITFNDAATLDILGTGLFNILG